MPRIAQLKGFLFASSARAVRGCPAFVQIRAQILGARPRTPKRKRVVFFPFRTVGRLRTAFGLRKGKKENPSPIRMEEHTSAPQSHA